MTREIELIESFGHLLAYEVDSPRALKVVASELPKAHFEALVRWWEQDRQSFVYVADLYVIPELRARGLGRELWEKFLKEQSLTIILAAGSFDTPMGLDLVSFYEEYDFYILEPCEYPLMIKEGK